jgi:hypothetical protein
VEGGHGGALVISREDKAEDKACPPPPKMQKIRLEKIRKSKKEMKEKMKEKEREKKEGNYGHFTLLSTLHS